MSLLFFPFTIPSTKQPLPHDQSHTSFLSLIFCSCLHLSRRLFYIPYRILLHSNVSVRLQVLHRKAFRSTPFYPLAVPEQGIRLYHTHMSSYPSTGPGIIVVYCDAGCKGDAGSAPCRFRLCEYRWRVEGRFQYVVWIVDEEEGMDLVGGRHGGLRRQDVVGFDMMIAVAS